MGPIENEYATATEWNLATLDEMISVKATSERRLDRQFDICYRMLLVCKELTASSKSLDWKGNGRVVEILDAGKTEPEGLKAALRRWFNAHRTTFGRK